MSPSRVTRRAALAAGSAGAVALLIESPRAQPTVEPSPKERIRHHLAELERAFRDYYPGADVLAAWNGARPHEPTDPTIDGYSPGCITVLASGWMYEGHPRLRTRP